MTYATTAQACIALRVNKQRLNELARQGKLPRGPAPNRWDIAACKAAVARNLDIRQASPARGDVPRGSIGVKTAPRPMDARVGGDDLPRGSQAHAQLLKLQAQAAIEGMKARQMDGRLLDSEEVRDAVNGMVVAFRSKVLVIGDELADKLASTSDAIKCREMVDARIYEALTALSEYPANAA
jgi:hypothetical protein